MLVSLVASYPGLVLGSSPPIERLHLRVFVALNMLELDCILQRLDLPLRNVGKGGATRLSASSMRGALPMVVGMDGPG